MSTKPLFSDFGLDDDLTVALSDRGIVHPFPIQELTLPLALKGHDIIGQARTGTGKTLGFGLPLLQRIDTSKSQTQALVIVPTRELCIQVADDLTVGADRGITTIAVYGGVGYDEQIEALTTGVHVVIGTPGRTIDHLNRGNLDVSQIHTVVLDEADEMLDMGFLPDVERLLADVPDDRQTLLFSATMPTEIVKLARRFMAKPTFMRADETLHETAPEVDQHFFLVHRMDKPRVLARLLQKPDRGGAFVFCRTKRMCDRLVQELDTLGVSAIAVHGDLRQASREKNLDRFRDGKADVLVATEVAARGLDVSNVTYVVNYDCPDDEKMYLHRIGRTARAGQSGVAVTFAEFNEVDRVNVIRKRVAVEDELMEVFSTSDELTELFDLPEQTPWDELASTTSGRSGGTSSKKKADRARKSSSGTNRSRRSGSGGDRSKGRRPGGRNRRSSDDQGSGSRRNAGTSSSGSGGKRDGGSSEGRQRADQQSSAGRRDDTKKQDTAASSSDRGSSSRSRTRTRSRTTTEAVVAEAVEARESDDSTSSDDRGTNGGAAGGDTNIDRPGRGSDTKKSSGSGSGRKRARSRARRNRGSSSSSSRGQDTDTSGSDARSPSTSGSTPTSGGNSKGGSRSRARSGKSKSGGRNDSRNASRSRSSRSRGKGTGTGGSKDGNGRSNGNGRSRGGSATPATTTRGDDARGDGTPRPRRRVEVEHLP